MYVTVHLPVKSFMGDTTGQHRFTVGSLIAYMNTIYSTELTLPEIIITYDELLHNVEVHSDTAAVSVPSVKRAVYAIFATFQLNRKTRMQVSGMSVSILLNQIIKTRGPNSG